MIRVAVVVAILVLAAGAASAPAGAQGLSIAVAVDETPVTDGAEVTATADPTFDISVEANAPLDAVVVRVDGETRHSFSPETQSFDETVVADLATGTNEIRVIARSTDDEVRSFRFTVLKDNRRPVVSFTAPFRTDQRGPPESTNVSGSHVTIAGNIHDHTGVTRMTITRHTWYAHAGAERVSRQSYRIADPGSSFSQEVFLGNGSNRVEVELRDRLDNVRVYETTLVVIDEAQPELHLEPVPEHTNAPRVVVEGEVTDNGQLDQIAITSDGGLRTVVNSKGPKPDEARVSIDIETEVALTPGSNTFGVQATDLVGNTVTEEFTVVYEESIAPVIELDEDQTSVTEDGELELVGLVAFGEITAVSVETFEERTGETVDFRQVYPAGAVTDSVPLSVTLGLAEGETRVVIRATDSSGAEHQHAFIVDPRSGAVGVDDPEDGTPESTPNDDETTNDSTAGEPDDDAAATPADPPGESGLFARVPGFGMVPAVIAIGLAIALVVRRRGPA